MTRTVRRAAPVAVGRGWRTAVGAAGPGWRTAVVAAVAAFVVAGGGPEASAASDDACDGVVVVVDPGTLGGAPTVGCASGAPTSGFDALARAGFEVEQVATMPGFVCRIDGRPDTACRQVPDADSYWSYWQAAPGTDWRESTRGAGDHVPDPGVVEGWAFGAGDPPDLSPAEAARSAPGPGAASGDGTTVRTSGASALLGAAAVAVLSLAAVLAARRRSRSGAAGRAPGPEG